MGELGEIEKLDPQLMETLSMKRSLDFRDSARVPHSFSGLNKLPMAAVKKVIRPDILTNDKHTVNYIIGRIKDDEATEDYYR